MLRRLQGYVVKERLHSIPEVTALTITRSTTVFSQSLSSTENKTPTQLHGSNPSMLSQSHKYVNPIIQRTFSTSSSSGGQNWQRNNDNNRSTQRSGQEGGANSGGGYRGSRDGGEGRYSGGGGYRGNRQDGGSSGGGSSGGGGFGGYRGNRQDGGSSGGYRGNRDSNEGGQGYRGRKGDDEGGYRGRRGDDEGGYRRDRNNEGGYRGGQSRDREGGYRGGNTRDREGGYRGGNQGSGGGGGGDKYEGGYRRSQWNENANYDNNNSNRNSGGSGGGFASFSGRNSNQHGDGGERRDNFSNDRSNYRSQQPQHQAPAEQSRLQQLKAQFQQQQLAQQQLNEQKQQQLNQDGAGTEAQNESENLTKTKEKKNKEKKGIVVEEVKDLLDADLAFEDFGNRVKAGDEADALEVGQLEDVDVVYDMTRERKKNKKNRQGHDGDEEDGDEGGAAKGEKGEGKRGDGEGQPEKKASEKTWKEVQSMVVLKKIRDKALTQGQNIENEIKLHFVKNESMSPYLHTSKGKIRVVDLETGANMGVYRLDEAKRSNLFQGKDFFMLPEQMNKKLPPEAKLIVDDHIPVAYATTSRKLRSYLMTGKGKEGDGTSGKQTVKEVRFMINVRPADMDRKILNVIDFLLHGHAVRVTTKFKTDDDIALFLDDTKREKGGSSKLDIQTQMANLKSRLEEEKQLGLGTLRLVEERFFTLSCYVQMVLNRGEDYDLNLMAARQRAASRVAYFKKQMEELENLPFNAEDDPAEIDAKIKQVEDGLAEAEKALKEADDAINAKQEELGLSAAASKKSAAEKKKKELEAKAKEAAALRNNSEDDDAVDDPDDDDDDDGSDADDVDEGSRNTKPKREKRTQRRSFVNELMDNVKDMMERQVPIPTLILQAVGAKNPLCQKTDWSKFISNHVVMLIPPAKKEAVLVEEEKKRERERELEKERQKERSREKARGKEKKENKASDNL